MHVFPINSKINRQHAVRAVSVIKGTDGMEVVIRKRVESGSVEQQAWFNMLCKMIADDTGSSPDAVKAHVKIEAFGIQTSTIAGKPIEYTPRSDLYGREGYSKLIDAVYVLGAEQGIVLPDPKPKRKREAS